MIVCCFHLIFRPFLSFCGPPENCILVRNNSFPTWNISFWVQKGGIPLAISQIVSVLYYCSPLIKLLWVFALGPGCILLDNSSVWKVVSNIMLKTQGRFEHEEAFDAWWYGTETRFEGNSKEYELSGDMDRRMSEFHSHYSWSTKSFGQHFPVARKRKSCFYGFTQGCLESKLPGVTTRLPCRRLVEGKVAHIFIRFIWSVMYKYIWLYYTLHTTHSHYRQFLFPQALEHLTPWRYQIKRHSTFIGCRT